MDTFADNNRVIDYDSEHENEAHDCQRTNSQTHGREQGQGASNRNRNTCSYPNRQFEP